MNKPTQGTAIRFKRSDSAETTRYRGINDYGKMGDELLRTEMANAVETCRRRHREWAAHANMAARYETLPGMEEELRAHMQLRDNAAASRDFWEDQAADIQHELMVRNLA